MRIGKHVKTHTDVPAPAGPRRAPIQPEPVRKPETAPERVPEKAPEKAPEKVPEKVPAGV